MCICAILRQLLLFFDSDEYGHDAHGDAIGDIGLQCTAKWSVAKCKLSTEMNRANAGQANQWCQEFGQVGLFSVKRPNVPARDSHDVFVFKLRIGSVSLCPKASTSHAAKKLKTGPTPTSTCKKRCCPVGLNETYKMLKRTMAQDPKASTSSHIMSATANGSPAGDITAYLEEEAWYVSIAKIIGSSLMNDDLYAMRRLCQTAGLQTVSGPL